MCDRNFTIFLGAKTLQILKNKYIIWSKINKFVLTKLFVILKNGFDFD